MWQHLNELRQCDNGKRKQLRSKECEQQREGERARRQSHLFTSCAMDICCNCLSLGFYCFGKFPFHNQSALQRAIHLRNPFEKHIAIIQYTEIEPKCVRKNFLKTKSNETKGEKSSHWFLDRFEVSERATAVDREEAYGDRRTALPPFDLYNCDSGVSIRSHVNFNLLCAFVCVCVV